MTKLFALLLLVSGFASQSFSAETQSGTSTNIAREENRFLFVVETSLPMNRMSKAAVETVRELIGSGVQGQMQPGDSFGIWTFNEQLNTDFPMQQWTEGAGEKLAQSSADFLKKKRFEKKGFLLTALQSLVPVVKSSRAITVILVSTGTEPMRGTPFDQQINSTYPVYARELREAKLPFVTTLVGRNGRLVAYSVNSSLGPIKIPNPPIAQPPVVAKPATNISTGATNSIAIAKPVVPNIIIGKPPVTNAVAPVVAANTNAAEKVEVPVAVVKTNVTTFTSVPAEGVTNVQSSPNPSVTNLALKSETTFVAATNSQTATATATSPPVEKSLTPQDLSAANRTDDPSALKPQAQPVATPSGASLTQPSQQIAAKTISKPKPFLMSLVVILLAIVAIVFFLVRRSHHKPQSSLISRSMEQRKK